jgi:hypothetical protein
VPVLLGIPRITFRNHVANPLAEAFLNLSPTGALVCRALVCPCHFGPLKVLHTLDLGKADPAQLDMCPHRAIGIGGQCASTVLPKHIVTRTGSVLSPEKIPQVLFQCATPSD